MERLIGIIPARGGSKSIPGKNMASVGGAPLIARAVLCALESGVLERVVVSTDCPRIARVAREAGADVVDRPAELSTDSASSESAILHALDELRQQGVQEPDGVVLVQCTSPLLAAEDVRGVVERWRRTGADVAFTVAPFHGFLWSEEDAEARAINHDATRRLRRQDRSPQFQETGGAYVMRAEGLRRARHRFFGRVVLHPVSARSALEVDEPHDLALARALLPEEDDPARWNALPEPVSAIAFDFDGVFTDDRVVVDETGREAVRCHRGDGYGVELLRQAGLGLVVISRERNPVVARRCEKLGLDWEQGVDEKLALLSEWARARGLSPNEMVFVGNDVTDVECMRWVGCGVAVADAHPEALGAAKIVLGRGGGCGAVRELADAVLRRRGAAGDPSALHSSAPQSPS